MALKVKAYSTPSCPHCGAAKSYFKSLGISFKDVGVSKNPKESEMRVKKTHQYGVPVIEMGDQVVMRFNRPKINKLLGVN